MQSLVVALNTIGAVSINRVHQIIGNVFGIPLSTGTVSNIVSRFAEAIKAQYARIGDSVAMADIAHFDETGTRVAGKTVWVHTASTKDATFLYLGLARGNKGMESGNVLPDFTVQPYTTAGCHTGTMTVLMQYAVPICSVSLTE